MNVSSSSFARGASLVGASSILLVGLGAGAASASTHGGGDRMGKTAPGAGTSSTTQLMDAAAQRAPMATTGEAARQTKGIDVASYQGDVDWASWKAKGVRFAYVKISENGHASNRYAASQLAGARKAGMYVGGYDYAAPSKVKGAGARQATAFVRLGGGWKANSKTLPGTLDLEQSVTGKGACYGLSQAQMRSYISEWTRTYKRLTGKDAVIYANPSFWAKCTGNTSMFNKTNPLWVAHWGTAHPKPLGGQKRYSLWQYKGAATGNSVDLDYFNGSERRLALFANKSW